MRDKHEELKAELDALFADRDTVNQVCEDRDFMIEIVSDWARAKIDEIRAREDTR